MVASRTSSAALVALDSPAWPDALAAVPHDVYHLPEYAAADLPANPGRPAAFVYRDRQHVFLLPLLIRDIPATPFLDATSSYGYPGPVSDCPPDDDSGFWCRAVEALTSTLADAGVVSCFVRVHPLLPVRLDALRGCGTLVERGRTVAIDLTRPFESVLSGIRDNHLRQIRSATRRGVRIRFDHWSHLDEFIDTYYENMRHVKADTSYFFGHDYFEALESRLGARTHLLTAHHEGAVIGGAIFFEHAGIVQYHLGAARTRHRDKQPLKTIIHGAIEWAKRRGDHVLHLGGGLGGRADSLFHFKAGFSADHFPFHTWHIVVDQGVYATLSESRGPAAGDDDLSFFPRYRRG